MWCCYGQPFSNSRALGIHCNTIMTVYMMSSLCRKFNLFIIQSCHVITIMIHKVNRSCDLGLCICVNNIVQK